MDEADEIVENVVDKDCVLEAAFEPAIIAMEPANSSHYNNFSDQVLPVQMENEQYDFHPVPVSNPDYSGFYNPGMEDFNHQLIYASNHRFQRNSVGAFV